MTLNFVLSKIPLCVSIHGQDLYCGDLTDSSLQQPTARSIKVALLPVTRSPTAQRKLLRWKCLLHFRYRSNQHKKNHSFLSTNRDNKLHQNHDKIADIILPPSMVSFRHPLVSTSTAGFPDKDPQSDRHRYPQTKTLIFWKPSPSIAVTAMSIAPDVLRRWKFLASQQRHSSLSNHSRLLLSRHTPTSGTNCGTNPSL